MFSVLEDRLTLIFLAVALATSEIGRVDAVSNAKTANKPAPPQSAAAGEMQPHPAALLTVSCQFFGRSPAVRSAGKHQQRLIPARAGRPTAAAAANSNATFRVSVEAPQQPAPSEKDLQLDETAPVGARQLQVPQKTRAFKNLEKKLCKVAGKLLTEIERATKQHPLTQQKSVFGEEVDDDGSEDESDEDDGQQKSREDDAFKDKVKSFVSWKVGK